MNCGHVAPLLLRASGELERWIPPPPCWAHFDSGTASKGQVSLAPGDTLLIYSDGVTEAEAPSGEEFGDERLVRCLRDSRGLTASSLMHCIVERVTEFSHGSRYDDVTVVVLKAI